MILLFSSVLVGAALLVQCLLWFMQWLSSDDSSSHPGLDADHPNPESGISWNGTIVLCFIVDGVAYHLQSVSVYTLMSFVSPVSVSVANTFKRALLILVSVFVFKNQVSSGAAVGTAITFLGVLWYNDTKTKESKQQAK